MLSEAVKGFLDFTSMRLHVIEIPMLIRVCRTNFVTMNFKRHLTLHFAISIFRSAG